MFDNTFKHLTETTFRKFSDFVVTIRFLFFKTLVEFFLCCSFRCEILRLSICCPAVIKTIDMYHVPIYIYISVQV